MLGISRFGFRNYTTRMNFFGSGLSGLGIVSMASSSSRNNQAALVLARVPIFILLAVFLGFFLYCLAQRLPYPFELEWIENEMVSHGMVLAQQDRIYPAPSTDFIAELYPPVYYLFIALFFKLFATVNFLIPRLISVAALAVILVLLYRLIIKEGGIEKYWPAGERLLFKLLRDPWHLV